MARSISIVEYKIMQTHFFLTRIQSANSDFFAAQCFTDAFVCAARSITFALQAVADEIPIFRPWYTVKQEELKSDRLTRFFNEYRRVSTHIGDTVVRGGSFSTDSSGQRVVKYYFMSTSDLPSVPEIDVVSACSDYFRTLLLLTFEAFTEFRYELNDRWYYTAGHFQEMGKTIENAEQELGFPRGWTDIGAPENEAERWRTLRQTQTVGCRINDLFEQYLGKSFKEPDENIEQ